MQESLERNVKLGCGRVKLQHSHHEACKLCLRHVSVEQLSAIDLVLNCRLVLRGLLEHLDESAAVVFRQNQLEGLIQCNTERLDVNTVKVKVLPLFDLVVAQLGQEIARQLKGPLANYCDLVGLRAVNEVRLRHSQSSGVRALQLELNVADLSDRLVELTLLHLLHQRLEGFYFGIKFHGQFAFMFKDNQLIDKRRSRRVDVLVVCKVQKLLLRNYFQR